MQLEFLRQLEFLSDQLESSICSAFGTKNSSELFSWLVLAL